MSGLIDNVMNHLGSDQINAIAGQLGVSPEQAEAAIAQALPVLVGGMARHSATPAGADALHGALTRDHSNVDIGGLLGGLLGGGGLGNLLNDSSGGLGGMLGNVLGGASGSSAQGGGLADIGGSILGHILGSRRGAAEQGLGQTTGLGSQGASQLMAILAPIVMAALAKMMHQRQLGPGDLGGMLGQETERARTQSSTTGGLLGAVLDRDGDGDVDLSDLMSIGGGLLGGRRS
ncbi:MAG: DUF937 domain-containing protein [Tahibacter sp.]